MENNRPLKRKITALWDTISDGRKVNPFTTGEKSRAFYQLEYVLTEAGLLARQRRQHGIAQPELLT